MIKYINYSRKFIGIFLVIFTLMNNTLIPAVNYYINNEPIGDLNTADVAGRDIYAEQISAYVAGNTSIITQSFFTNDSNFLPDFNTNDPHLEKCNLVITASNGINPAIFPRVITGDASYSPPNTNFNGFTGFLYYDNNLSLDSVQKDAIQVLKYIKLNFHMDIIMVNSTDPYFFPFVGYYPNWEIYFNAITANIPKDGYFKALDIDRLTNENYYNNHHLSSSIVIINSIEFLEILSTLPTDQLNFNFDPTLMQGFDLDELLDLFNVSSSDELFSFDSHYITLTIQYEGNEQGIEIIGPNQYAFNLWKAMNYYGKPLRPSDKIFISLLGIFLSGLDINVLCTEIYNTTPNYLEFDEETIDRLNTLLALTGEDINLDILNYLSWELLWVGEYGTYRSHIRPVVINWDVTNPEEFALHALTDLTLKNGGFQGLNTIPTGMLNEINQFIVTYNLSNSEHNMKISRELIGDNASFGVDRGEFNFTITVENIGYKTVWGVPFSYATPPNLEFLIFSVVGNPFTDLYDRLTTLVNNNCSISVEDYVNFYDEVRVFEVDSLGTGAVDYYYPWNPLDASAEDRMPYSLELAKMMEESADPSFSPSEINYFKNTDSIRNPDNWKLEPGESFSYNISSGVDFIDTYTAFSTNNFTYNASTPYINNGTSILNTNASMALELDNNSWIIQSENHSIDIHDFGIDFIFQNETALDLVNFSIDRISIVVNFTQNSSILDTISGLIYNFSLGAYQNITATSFNTTWRFSLINFNNSINDIFDPGHLNNFTVKFRLNGTSSEPFNTSINDINIEYEIRDINSITRQGAQVLFGPESRISQLSRRSSSVTLGTDEIASIIAFANLTSYNSSLGELNTYTLRLKSIGSLNAENLSISIDLPGILHENNNFTFANNTLTYEKKYLNVTMELILNFTFYTPNSGEVDNVFISYDTPKVHPLSNASSILNNPNEVFFSAPVNYEDKIPFVRTIEVFYNTSTGSPQINDVFNLTVNMKNTSPYNSSIPDLRLSMNDNYGDLVRIDNKRNISYTNISFDEIISFNITLNKTDWKAYYYPAINFIRGSESSTLQISRSSHIVLGNINITVSKSVNRNQIEIGDQIIVSIEIQNTGTICIKNIDVEDMISYSISDFSLVSGKLNNEIIKLEPNETISFNYTIQAKRQNSLTLKEAYVEYYYLSRIIVESNTVNIKIITPIMIQRLYILFPSLLTLGIIIIFLWQIKKYRTKKYEKRRHELLLFELSSRESIIKVENTLRDRLNILSKTNVDVNLEKKYKDKTK
ncbi:MAG: hypothetical protein ACFFBP_03545 [Promethearchaeota archaeon]